MWVTAEGKKGFRGKIRLTEASVDTRCIQVYHKKVNLRNNRKGNKFEFCKMFKNLLNEGGLANAIFPNGVSE